MAFKEKHYVAPPHMQSKSIKHPQRWQISSGFDVQKYEQLLYWLLDIVIDDHDFSGNSDIF